MSDWQKQTAATLRDLLGVMGQRQLPTNKDGFDEEFDDLRTVDYKMRCNRDEFYSASLGSNMSKNRFRDVLANEGTRVVLEPLNPRGDGDYINANYIDGRRLFGVPFVYIATQAPLSSTIGDFWRMVYENNCVFIVMLCAEIEAGKRKSERYWPDAVGDVLPVGPMNIVLLSENHRADSVFRTIALRTLEGKERTIYHLQYTRWPDQSIPQSSSGLMDIIHALGQSAVSTQTPIIVHCSGGVGRTGVFIALHVALALFELEQPVSVPRIVQYLKYCRSGMVQRKDQYLFCYYALLREMEKLIWGVEAQKHTDFKMYPVPGAAAVIERRAREYLPTHPAQVQPHLNKSILSQPATANQSAVRQPPEHSIRVVSTLQPPGLEFARGIPGGTGLRGPESQAEELESVVAKLQQQNALRRQTPAREMGSRTFGSEGAFDYRTVQQRAAPDPSLRPPPSSGGLLGFAGDAPASFRDGGMMATNAPFEPRAAVPMSGTLSRPQPPASALLGGGGPGSNLPSGSPIRSTAAMAPGRGGTARLNPYEQSPQPRASEDPFVTQAAGFGSPTAFPPQRRVGTESREGVVNSPGAGEGSVSPIASLAPGASRPREQQQQPGLGSTAPLQPPDFRSAASPGTDLAAAVGDFNANMFGTAPPSATSTADPAGGTRPIKKGDFSLL